MLDFFIALMVSLPISAMVVGFLARLDNDKWIYASLIDGVTYKYNPKVNLLGRFLLRPVLQVTKGLVILGGLLSVPCKIIFKFLFLKKKSCPEED